MTDPDIISMQLTSAAFSGPDSIEAFRETYGRLLMQLEIDPLPGVPFELDFRIRGVNGFSIADGRLSPTTNRHTASMIDNDDIVLVHAVQGHGALRQIGREVDLPSGNATFVTNSEAGEFLGYVPSQLQNFRFTRKRLEGVLVDIDDGLLRSIPPDDPTLGLLTRYAGILNDEEALALPELRDAIVTHMHDLAAILLGPNRNGQQIASRRGVRAAKLHAIQDDIKRNLAARDLTLDAVAQRNGISARTARDLFREWHTTFTDYVLKQRLAMAHRKLLDARFAESPISSIAFDCGFGDLSYFNHSFRRRYGARPSDIRAAGLGKTP